MPAAITSKTAKKILVLLLITDYTEESEKDSEEDLGKLAVHASSCAKKNGWQTGLRLYHWIIMLF